MKYCFLFFKQNKPTIFFNKQEAPFYFSQEFRSAFFLVLSYDLIIFGNRVNKLFKKPLTCCECQ